MNSREAVLSIFLFLSFLAGCCTPSASVDAQLQAWTGERGYTFDQSYSARSPLGFEVLENNTLSPSAVRQPLVQSGETIPCYPVGNIGYSTANSINASGTADLTKLYGAISAGGSDVTASAQLQHAASASVQFTNPCASKAEFLVPDSFVNGNQSLMLVYDALSTGQLSVSISGSTSGGLQVQAGGTPGASGASGGTPSGTGTGTAAAPAGTGTSATAGGSPGAGAPTGATGAVAQASITGSSTSTAQFQASALYTGYKAKLFTYVPVKDEVYSLTSANSQSCKTLGMTGGRQVCLTLLRTTQFGDPALWWATVNVNPNGFAVPSQTAAFENDRVARRSDTQNSAFVPVSFHAHDRAELPETGPRYHVAEQQMLGLAETTTVNMAPSQATGPVTLDRPIVVTQPTDVVGRVGSTTGISIDNGTAALVCSVISADDGKTSIHLQYVRIQ